MSDTEPQVIHLRLESASEMFQPPQADPFSPYFNYLTGLEYCLSLLLSRGSRAPVRLEVSLPAAEATEGVGGRISGALRRYCEHRIACNDRERRAGRRTGLAALWIGVPITIVGFCLAFPYVISGVNEHVTSVLDTGGWVLVWIGLWYPLDTLFFSRIQYDRENRALRLLKDASIVVQPREDVTTV